MKLPGSYFLQDIHQVAISLLGDLFVRLLPSGKKLSGRIVEVEVYKEIGDPASHSFKGYSKRNAVMFGPPGRLYVYFTYGMHYCCNIVCGPEHSGNAILIRALEPIEGIEDMVKNRFGEHYQKRKHFQNLTNGPAKLCKALCIDSQQNGWNLDQDMIWIEHRENLPPKDIGCSSRIGISLAKDLPWRYFIKTNPWVTKTGKGIRYFD